jgi:hypothetical protein
MCKILTEPVGCIRSALVSSPYVFSHAPLPLEGSAAMASRTCVPSGLTSLDRR